MEKAYRIGSEESVEDIMEGGMEQCAEPGQCIPALLHSRLSRDLAQRLLGNEDLSGLPGYIRDPLKQIWSAGALYTPAGIKTLIRANAFYDKERTDRLLKEYGAELRARYCEGCDVC